MAQTQGEEELCIQCKRNGMKVQKKDDRIVLYPKLNVGLPEATES